MSSGEPTARSHRRLWVVAAVLALLGGLGYGLFTAVDRVRESAARSD